MTYLEPGYFLVRGTISIEKIQNSKLPWVLENKANQVTVALHFNEILDAYAEYNVDVAKTNFLAMTKKVVFVSLPKTQATTKKTILVLVRPEVFFTGNKSEKFESPKIRIRTFFVTSGIQPTWLAQSFLSVRELDSEFSFGWQRALIKGNQLKIEKNSLFLRVFNTCRKNDEWILEKQCENGTQLESSLNGKEVYKEKPLLEEGEISVGKDNQPSEVSLSFKFKKESSLKSLLLKIDSQKKVSVFLNLNAKN